MKVLFVSGFGPIITEPAVSSAFYTDTLQLPLKSEGEGYWHTDQLSGVNHFALWPLAQAAQSCFGTDVWPDTVPTPTAWVEYDVEDIEAATEELKAAGYSLLVERRTESWGQIVTRLMSPEGVLTGIVVTPWMRE